ncbi:MAG: ArsR family transcriptional regulator [Gammaproteobacteria bacterium]|nr:MAG: ArsR family transcriptional regulator [Gammaproteobacteria bacterium]RLA43284.1 MAG: ArsR family transcriptional regulator [Gammaproteobacteria bacterium]
MDLELMRENAAQAAGLMKLLGHPHRMMILCELKQGECSVSELSEKIGIPQSPLSQHLARMRHEGVVTSRREAQTVYYSLVGQEVAAVVSLLYELYCEGGACKESDRKAG